MASADGLLLYTYQGVSYKIRAGDLLQVAGVPTTRRVLAGTGLTGGGQLSSDITLSIAPGGVGATELNNTGVTPGVYGNTTFLPQLTIDANGRVTAATVVPAGSAFGGTVTSINVSGGGTGLTTSGGPVTTSGTVTLAGTLNVASGGTAATTASGARANLSAAVLGANNDITSLSAVTGGVATPDYVTFDTAITPVTAVGKLQWDPTWQGLQVGMGGGAVNLQIGQETLIYVHNDTGAALTDGQVVYVTGSQGQRVTVALAQANADSTSATIIGVVAEHIGINASGFVTTQGMVSGVNTSGMADGAVVWLSPTTPGAYTTTKPQAPEHLVMVGYVVKGGSVGGGSIYIHPQNGYELEELHDVRITSVANNDLLQYYAAGPYWRNAAASSVAVGSATNLAGGAASQLPYQTGAGATSFIANGTAGQVLLSNGAAAPSWGGVSGGTF